jgi:hypothetical protein
MWSSWMSTGTSLSVFLARKLQPWPGRRSAAPRSLQSTARSRAIGLHSGIIHTTGSQVVRSHAGVPPALWWHIWSLLCACPCMAFGGPPLERHGLENHHRTHQLKEVPGPQISATPPVWWDAKVGTRQVILPILSAKGRGRARGLAHNPLPLTPPPCQTLAARRLQEGSTHPVELPSTWTPASIRSSSAPLRLSGNIDQWQPAPASCAHSWTPWGRWCAWRPPWRRA